MNILKKNITISLLIFAILFNTTVSCKKDEALQSIIEPQTEEVGEQKVWVGWFIAAVVIVIIKVTEGQYEKVTSPDGTITEKCKGMGSCAMRVVIPPTGEDDEIDVSSVHYYEQVDYTSEGILGFDKEGNIVLAISNTVKDGSRDRFFYDKKISISRPLVIDNPDVLKQLNVSEKIVVQGDYIVNASTEKGEDWKYIVIK